MKLNTRDKIISVLTLTSALVLSSCSSDKGFSEHDRTEAYFMDDLGGEISPAQWWQTTVTLNIMVNSYSPVKMLLMSDNAKGTLYDLKEAPQSGTYTMTAPQGKGNTLYLVYLCDRIKSYKKITLSGKTIENITLDTTLPATRAMSGETLSKSSAPFMQSFILADNNDDDYDPTVHPSLMGHSFSSGAIHFEFKDSHKSEAQLMLSIIKDNTDAKYDLGLNCDYELESNGPFNITWLAGSGASQAEHVLGYYTHSENTYDDLEFHDLAETHKYDIIDNLAKVQYQISDDAYQTHKDKGILPNKWYDANFDNLDIFGSKQACNPVRVGDQAYNSINLFKTYDKGISRIRGLSFEINVPVGKRVGFYLKANEERNTEQWDQLNRLGIKGIGNRDNWRGTNFCVEAFNQSQSHRSCIIPYTTSTWMGMEDRFDGGDHDCNDVMFGITSEVAIHKPTIIVPDINLMINLAEKFPWTIAYEDVSRQADFDFNDAVIKVIPDYEKETCSVTVEAAGSPQNMYLHYDGPQGDVNLGEIHQLLYGNANTTINTKTSQAYAPFTELESVPWPKDYTMAKDAKRFWIEIRRGECKDCTDAITLAMEPGKMPEALLVAGEWKWPKEGIHIFSAYSNFHNWAKDLNKTSYWNWYASPKSSAVVSY